jgi:hypothetical protein
MVTFQCKAQEIKFAGQGTGKNTFFAWHLFLVPLPLTCHQALTFFELLFVVGATGGLQHSTGLRGLLATDSAFSSLKNLFILFLTLFQVPVSLFVSMSSLLSRANHGFLSKRFED